MRLQRTLIRWIACAVALGTPAGALAFGSEAHLIVGIAAERELCEAAHREVATLGNGQGLAELGLWADRIRDDRDYYHADPWHYVNLAEGESLRTLVHPPQGDVLWAIDRFKARLADRSLPTSEHAEALKFLVHFIVDVHQPLHVTRVGDRGGNQTNIRTAGGVMSLHAFWDVETVELANLSVSQYARRLRADMEAAATTGANLDPVAWAEESFALNPVVYGVGENEEPSAEYVERSIAITRERLALAALRLAGTLNELFCAP